MKAIDFDTAFKYPFNRAKGMLNIFWVLLPIIGWFALGGYGVRIVQEFTKGKFKELPIMNFGDDLKLGFFMFIKAIPFAIAIMVVFGILSNLDPMLGGLAQLLVGILIFPMLTINFMNKMTWQSLFEWEVVKPVFNNFGDYAMAFLKSLALAIVFIVLMIVLVGIPANAFTKNIFFADFYRRRVK